MEAQEKQLPLGIIGFVAAGVVVGLAVWNLLDGFIRYLLCPVIAGFIGSSRFHLNTFTINASEIPYGAFLESLFAAALVILLVSILLPEWKRSFARGTKGE